MVPQPPMYTNKNILETRLTQQLNGVAPQTYVSDFLGVYKEIQWIEMGIRTWDTFLTPWYFATPILQSWFADNLPFIDHSRANSL